MTEVKSEIHPSTLEEQASYGIGLQMGDQLNSMFEGASLECALEGLRHAFNGDMPTVSSEDVNAAFTVIQERMKEQQAVKAKAAAGEGEAFLAENADRDDIHVTDTGLQYEIITQGDGDLPTATSTVRTHYRGTLINGTEFDSSYSRNEPTEFPVNGVIAGWTEALQLMPVGSKWKLYVPYSLAYGENGAGGAIGPFQALVFELELLAIV
ncbi:MAG: FKBP-type peptidyl-prolyl cis-trans isomerase FklB [Candidatus Endobugula sp.]|jgi:FKBP-type peptidyl-prolyl cis-trans isomerase FklB